jgi:ribosomal protein S18 acetylase RimI-like enzyme
MLEYSRASRDELAAVVEFIAPLNIKAEHRIGYLGEKPEEITQELLEYGAIDYAFVARQNGELVGFMAVDVDDELDRSYLFGPFVNLSAVSPSRPRPDNWHEVAKRLVTECLAIVPDNTTAQTEMFFDRSNDNVSKLGRSLGFRTYKDVRTFRFDRTDLDQIGRGTGTQPEARHHSSLVELHDRTFPNTHLPGTRMIEGLGQNKACFVRIESDEVVGYTYLEVDDTTGSASLEFLGTAERARGRGIGADLVRTGLRWMFGFESVSETWLVVDEGNTDARRLYERLGWAEVHRLTSMRRAGRPESLVNPPVPVVRTLDR